MINKKKPPDKNQDEQVYKIIKCPLKSVLKEYNKLQPIIDDIVKDINKFVILGYQFIRLYLLDKFNNNKPFPTINKNFILDVLKTISTSETNRGKSNKDTNIKNKDCKDDLSPVLSEIVDPNSGFNNAQQRQIRNKMEEILTTRYNSFHAK